MAHTTSHIKQTSFRSGSVRHTDQIRPANDDLAMIIEDTIRMIENTRSFLNRLDRSQYASHESISRSCARLEAALASLKRRQRSLSDSDC